MNGLRMLKLVAVVSAICGVLGSVESADACGLRHRCCVPVCRPMPCPVMVAMPVRVVPVPVVMPVQVAPVVPMAAPAMGGMPHMGGPRVVTKKYKITKIRYKVPKKHPAPNVCPPVCAPVVCAPVVCAPVACAPVICTPVICCPVPVICPPACLPARCCPLRRCR